MSSPTPVASPHAAPDLAGGAAPAPAHGSHAARPAARPMSPWPAALRVSAIASLVVTLVLLAFVWPTYTSKVHHVPVTVVGPEQATSQLTSTLTKDEQFDVTSVGDRDAAVRSIRERDSYGSFVVSGDRIEVLTASAASPVVAQSLRAIAQGMQLQLQGQALKAATSGQTTTKSARKTASGPTSVGVTEIVPLAADDARGSVLPVAGLPLAMGGMLGGVLISFLVVGHWRRAAAILGYGVLAGLILTLVLDPWFGVLTGNFAVEWLVIGLSLIATASIIVGLHGLIGPPGIGIGAVLTLFIGNPLSSASAPPEFLPWHWGTIGQWFVPGAGSALLRLTSYFPDAPTARYWWALVLWAALGTMLLLFGHFRDQRVVRVPGFTEPEHEASRRTTSRPAPRPVHGEAESAQLVEQRDDRADVAGPNATVGGQIRGVVSVSGGRALSEVHVTATDLAGHEVDRTAVNSDGSFTVHVPAEGTYLLISSGRELTPSADYVRVTGPTAWHEVTLVGSSSMAGAS